MSEQIRMTPSELRDGAKSLQTLKEECLQNLGAMKTEIDRIAADWEGSSQNAFVAKFEETYKSTTESLTDSVDGISKILETSAETIEAADAQIASALR